MLIRLIVYGLALFLAAASIAADRGRYVDPRFGFVIDIPSGYAVTQQADNGDGWNYRSADGKVTLAVWAQHLGGKSLRTEAAERLEWYKGDGWNVTYQRETDGWASYSGLKAGTIFYYRAVALCDGAAGYFVLEFPEGLKPDMEKPTLRLVRSFRPVGGCASAPTVAPAAN
ncbi:hypothetical protein [Sinorhizobium sp. BG8]|uniref:hypothetical protein n=1 Tax=Sinorhizobium sp. BG8 TaxID=2613773 RepID=UPI00193D4E18|nr:hypothetical protein [Sinorhizobium sp. BG8]QRM54686.1 hypothetical protein F3Y30_09110 [Sinorhizobium sp. BG8]